MSLLRKTKKTIKILGAQTDILSVSLMNILNSLPDVSKMTWAFLWLNVTTKFDNQSIIFIKDTIKNSEHGVLMNWVELKDFVGEFSQEIEIAVVADISIEKIKSYKDKDEILMAAYCSIELIDSSYWIINSRDDKLLQSLSEKLPGVTFV